MHQSLWTESSRARGVFFVVACVVVAVLLVGGTWFAASVFQSPQQRAADAAAPGTEPVYGEARRGALTQSLTYSGTISSEHETGYTLPQASDAVRSVVTARVTNPGATVASGDVVSEVNGRPVYAVESDFALYRDIGFGDEGPDVLALQEMLVDEGLLGYADGAYGALTAAAVRWWYWNAGYSAPMRVRAEDAPTALPGSATTEEEEVPEVPKEDTYVPVSDVLAASPLPAQVVMAPAVGANVGVEGNDDVVLGSTDLVVRADAPGAEAIGIVPGDSATVVLDGEELAGIVNRIEHAEESSDGAQRPDVLVVEFDSPGNVPADARGASVTAQVETETVAEDTLIVPSTAVVGRGGDDAVVVKKQNDDSLIEVSVTVTGSLAGRTGVEPVDPGRLTEGDEVRVG